MTLTIKSKFIHRALRNNRIISNQKTRRVIRLNLNKAQASQALHSIMISHGKGFQN